MYDHQIFSQQRYGGVSRYFHEISNRIPEIEGDEVEVFAPLYVNKYGEATNSIRPRGLRVRELAGTTSALGFTNAILGNLFVRPRKNVAIFHETYYAMRNYAPKHAKRVVTVFDMIHELYPKYFSKTDPTPGIKQHAVHRADHVICISESTRRDLVRHLRIPVDKTSVVHLGYSLTETLDGKAGLPKLQKSYLLYVGKRRGYKNFRSLLHAYGQSKLLKRNFSLVCFGGGSFAADELSLMESLGIKSDSVVYVSGDDAVLASLYSAAAALIYPSLYEGFGIPPLEAMAHGCPVICTNTSSLPEVVGNAAALFDPHNQNSIRTVIENVVFSVNTSRQLTALGHERIKSFSWDKCARATLNIYKQVLGDQRS